MFNKLCGLAAVADGEDRIAVRHNPKIAVQRVDRTQHKCGRSGAGESCCDFFAYLPGFTHANDDYLSTRFNGFKNEMNSPFRTDRQDGQPAAVIPRSQSLIPAVLSEDNSSQNEKRTLQPGSRDAKKSRIRRSQNSGVAGRFRRRLVAETNPRFSQSSQARYKGVRECTLRYLLIPAFSRVAPSILSSSRHLP